jgi:hypothetical protein
VLQGFINLCEVFQYQDEQIVALTADTHVVFTFTHVDSSISTTDYTLESSESSWNFAAVLQDSIYIINSETELMNYIIGSNPPPIDFDQYSLLLVHGQTISGSITNISKNLLLLSSCNYELNIEVQVADTVDSQPWHIAMITPKLNAVTSNIQYVGAKVLMLTVDFQTNTFQGGQEFIFSNNSDTFTIINEYKDPGDFGYLKLYYKEINEMLFYGTIIWAGYGNMEFPQNLLDTNQFQRVITSDSIVPKNGFEYAFPDPYGIPDYSVYKLAWHNVQTLVKTREYLQANPEQTVKIFLYAPNVGGAGHDGYCWIIYLKR